MDKWNQYKNALRDMLTKPDGTVDMEDGAGAIITLPTFPALQKLVNELNDKAGGAVAGSQAAASSAAMSANGALKSEQSALDAASSAKASSDAASGSQGAAAASESNASSSEINAAKSETHAEAASIAASKAALEAATSSTTAKAYADNAGFSAASASSSKEATAGFQNLAQQYANAPVNVQVEPGRYSAYHWSEQARLISAGALIYRGTWSAAGGVYPSTPKLGDFYLIGTTGTIGGVRYGVGDMLMYDGSAWDRIDNQQVVTSVAGRTGAVTLSTVDISGLQAALDTKQNLLGYTPVQMATGVGQNSNTIKIGWANDGSGKLLCTVDVTNQGAFAFESWVRSNYLPLSGGTVTGNTTFNAGTWFYSQMNVNNVVYVTDTNPGATIANNGNGGHRGLTCHANNNGGSSATSAACMTFIRDAVFGCYFGMDVDNQLKIGGWSFGNASYRVVHEGLGTINFNGRLNVNNADIVCTNWMYAANFKLQSDARLKTDAKVLDGAVELDKLEQLIARSYTKAGHHELGFFAQELAKVYPTMVTADNGPAGKDTLSISHAELIAPIVAALQDVNRRMKKAGL